MDIDLDFFLRDTAFWPDPDARLSDEDYPVWTSSEVMAFLTNQCHLTTRRPGFVVERHDELFDRWRLALRRGLIEGPFHVTHVDAHADLGLGDAGWTYLCSDLMFRDPSERTYPNVDDLDGLNQGNYLAFALACGWISDLTYVRNTDERFNDLLDIHMEGFDPLAPNLQLKAITATEIERSQYGLVRPLAVERLDVPVPFRRVVWTSFVAPAPFDMLCLCRSPQYTPPAADAIFDLIREHFIDEVVP